MSRARAASASPASPAATSCSNVCAAYAAACPPISSSTGTKRRNGDFFDTNVLSSLLSADAKKADRAEALVRKGGAISVQVLNEAANVARRKLAMDWRETRQFLATLSALLTVAPLTAETHALGLDFAGRYKLSIYDAMIAAAATLAGCARLWSQDMQDGMKIGERLRVADPFK